MPIYEYTCEVCGHDFEELVRNKAEEEDLACPSCAGRKLSRKMSVFGVQGNVSKPILSGGSSCSGCKATSCAGCH
jgi:putative FmdB family regulatory protein